MALDSTPDALRELVKSSKAWIYPTERARKEKRVQSSMGELVEFYDRVQPLFPAMIEYLDGRPIIDPTSNVREVGLIALMYLEAAMAVEFYRQPELPAFPGSRFHISVLPDQSL